MTSPRALSMPAHVRTRSGHSHALIEAKNEYGGLLGVAEHRSSHYPTTRCNIFIPWSAVDSIVWDLEEDHDNNSTPSFIERYDAWRAHRVELNEQENNGPVPLPEEWHYSDDDAVALLEEAASLIRRAAEGCATITEALADHFYAHHAGFTCSEAEAYYDGLRALGLDRDAEIFMRHHAESDDLDKEPGDVHTAEGDRGWRRLTDAEIAERNEP